MIGQVKEIELSVPSAFTAVARCWIEWKRYFVYYGGRGGGKSENICRILLVKAMEDRIRVLCCRELQKSINDSVYKLLCEIIEAEGMGDFYTCMADRIVGLS